MLAAFVLCANTYSSLHGLRVFVVLVDKLAYISVARDELYILKISFLYLQRFIIENMDRGSNGQCNQLRICWKEL